jgi:hypothetical protein
VKRVHGQIPWLTLAAHRRAPWIVIASLCVIGILQNVYLAAFTGQPGPLWKVWIYELSSGAVLLALSVFVAWTSSRFPLRPFSIPAAAAHAAASLVFSVIHVATMVAIRKGVFLLLGDHYNFGPPMSGFAYEYGKDAFTYAVFLACFWIGTWARNSVSWRVETEGFRARGGITVKTARGSVFVPFAAILCVEASGNYVSLFAAEGEFLHRATMKEMEELLPRDDFARTHRSHIVRLTAVRSVNGGNDGERMLELQGGRRVPLSRSYARARDWTMPLCTSAQSNRQPTL